MIQFLKSLFAPSESAPRAAGLTLTSLEGRDCPTALTSSTWVTIQPQPLPPGGTVTIQPQPLPPKNWVLIQPQPLPPRW